MTSKINAGARIWVAALGASLVLGSCTDPDSTGPVPPVDPVDPVDPVAPVPPVDPVDPVDPVATQPIPAAITMVSGNHQEGKAGIPLHDPFVVRITDAEGREGRGVEGAQVTWKLASGAGQLWSMFHGERYLCDTIDGCTDAHGLSYVQFRPTTVGPITVTAEAAGLTGSPVTFTADVTAMVILLGRDWSFASDEERPVVFIGPDGTPDVTVPVGTHVEWILLESLFPLETAHITSTSVPQGGEPFDSGGLYVWWGDTLASFVFVPGVAGTWEFVDQVSGASGTLTAQ